MKLEQRGATVPKQSEGGGRRRSCVLYVGDHSPSAIKTAAKVNLCLIDQSLLTHSQCSSLESAPSI